MDAQPQSGFTLITIIAIFGLTIIIWQLGSGIVPAPVAFITHRVQSHQYVSEEPNCKVQIIYNLSSSDLKQIQDERKSRIKEVCGLCRRNSRSVECDHVMERIDYQHVRPELYNHLLVNDKHKVIYCYIPKAGCGTWKRTMARSYTGKDITVQGSVLHTKQFLYAHGMRRLNTYSENEIRKRLKTYYKFLVARHPMERLVSAFRNKFERSQGVEPLLAAYADKIRKQGNDSNLSFFNFVEYISSTHHYHYESKNKRKGPRYLEPHWAQYSTLCHPCHIDYDYIVKFETMREDAAYVLSKLGPHDKCLEQKYPELFNKNESTSSVFDEYFSTLTTAQIKRLKDIYSVDFKMFGY